MPTIPLYDFAAHAGEWHDVSAPGGYEWWSFEAAMSGGDVQIRLDIFDGDPFNHAYRAAYSRYRRRPTRVAPPVPREYPAARLTIHSKPALQQRVEAPASPGAFEATPARIRVGPAVILTPEDPFVRRVSWNGLIDLTFRGTETGGAETQKFESDESTSVHYWTVIGTSFDVTGTLRGSEFAGRGRHDHFFGTGPISAKMVEVREGLSTY